jgi:RND superfamily putative drug exporter
MILVPAIMSLLGRHAWWIPKWLDRITPNLDIEGTTHLTQQQPTPASAATPD